MEVGPIATMVGPLIRIASSVAMEPLLMSTRRVVLIRISSLGGEDANVTPIAKEKNRATRSLRIIIPPEMGTSLIVRAFVLQIRFMRIALKLKSDRR